MGNGPESVASSLLSRAKLILLRPAEEWPKIAAEDTTTREVLIRYVIPLSLIAPIAGFIGGQVFGYGAFGIVFRPSLVSALIMAVVLFALSLINFLIMTLIADFLSPKFGGELSNQKSFKLVAYSATAIWLSGIFGLVPALSVFGLLGFYSVYLLYTGVKPMLNMPSQKVLPYTVTVILCALLLNFVMYGLSQANMRFLSGMGLLGNDTAANGTISVPGMGKIDVDEAQKLGKQMEDAASGKSPPVEAAKLQALLPQSIGSYKRTAMETLAMGPMGSTAEGTYEASDRSFNLKIIDMSAMGAIAGMGAAMGVTQTREDADGYEKTGTVDGRIQTEAWDKSNSSGKFGVVFANRFMVEAEGNAASIDELKQAVASVDEGDLEDLVE